MSLSKALGFSALMAFSGAEGCAAQQANAQPTGRYDWFTQQDNRQGSFEPEQLRAFRYGFELARNRGVAHLTGEEEQALNRRIDAVGNEEGRPSTREVNSTMNEVGIESAWQRLGEANIQTTWVANFPQFERGSDGRLSYDYQELDRLAGALSAPHEGAIQLHVTEQTVNNQLTSDDHGSGGGAIRGGINIVLRGNEGAQFRTLLPAESPNLHTERRLEHRSVSAIGSTEDVARARAVARFVGAVQQSGVYIREEGGYYLNDHVINTVTFTRQSLAVYLRNVRFDSRQVTNPETGTLATEVTLSADVLDYEPPQDHQNHEDRAIVRPLFPGQR